MNNKQFNSSKQRFKLKIMFKINYTIMHSTNTMPTMVQALEKVAKDTQRSVRYEYMRDSIWKFLSFPV